MKIDTQFNEAMKKEMRESNKGLEEALSELSKTKTNCQLIIRQREELKKRRYATTNQQFAVINQDPTSKLKTSEDLFGELTDPQIQNVPPNPEIIPCNSPTNFETELSNDHSTAEPESTHDDANIKLLLVQARNKLTELASFVDDIDH